MLQSGKRHARLKPQDILKLQVDIDFKTISVKKIKECQDRIKKLQETLSTERENINDLFLV